MAVKALYMTNEKKNMLTMDLNITSRSAMDKYFNMLFCCYYYYLQIQRPQL